MDGSEYYRQLGTHVPEVFWLFDHQIMKMADISPAYESIHGCNRAQLYEDPSHYIAAIHPDDRGIVFAAVEKQACGERTDIEYRVVYPDGTARWIHNRTFPIFDNTGGLIYTTGIATDVTERRQAEANLRASEERFRSLFETMAQGVVYQDACGEITAANPAAERILGLTLDQMQGRTSSDPGWRAVHEDGSDFPGESHPAMAALRTGRPVRDVVMGVYVPAEDVYRWINVNAVPQFKFGETIPYQVYTTFEDITERKHAEALVYAQRDLARGIGTFVAAESGFRAIVELMLRLTGMDSGGIYLFSSDTQSLDLIYHQGFGTEFIEAIASFPLDYPNVQLALTGKPAYFGHDHPVAQSSLYLAEHLCSAAAIPILYQDRVIGCVNLASHTEGEVHGFARQAVETLAVEVGNFVVHLQSQASLRASEEKFRQLADTINEVFWIFDNEQQRLVYLNPAYEKVWGISITDTYRDSRKYVEAIHADDRPILFAALAQQERGEPTEMEYRIVRPDGTVRWIFDRSFPILGEDGRVQRTAGVATDVTALKHIQQELLELNRSLEARVAQRTAEVQDLYDNAPIGYHSLDANGCFVQVNQTELNWLGYTRDELIGRSITETAFPTSQAVYHDNFPSFKVRGWLRDLEVDMVRKDGSTFPVLVNATAVYDDQGSFVASRSTVFDNTERKHAELALRESEEQNRLLFEQTPEAVVLFDEQGRIVRANHAFERLVGLAADQCMGQTVAALGLLPEQQVAALVSAIVEGLQAQGSFASAEFKFVGTNGDPRDVGVRVFGVTFVGRPHFLTSMRDITAEKQVEGTLRLANAELVRALRMKDEFLANMSHELRTPLHGILAVSETLLDEVRGPLNERQQKSVRLIEESGRHLLALINDLLDLSKIEAGKLELHLAPVPVDDVCRGSLLFVRELAAKKEIGVEYANSTPGVQITADEQRIKQMLVNLLSNAVKFTPNGGHVRLRVAVDQDAKLIHFAVEDDGPGIAPADQAKLFEPFIQLDARLSRQYEGSGLGLALVKRLAEQHGGTVRLDSTGIPGEGCCFTVTLPTAPG